MTPSDTVIQSLPPERRVYMQQAAAEAKLILERFAGGPLQHGPTALQFLDEWIDRVSRQGPLSQAARVLVMAFLGQTFLHRHGGYWAIQQQGRQQRLGTVCRVIGSREETRFIDIAGQVGKRLSHGISDSLTFFYLTTSVDLQGRS